MITASNATGRESSLCSQQLPTALRISPQSRSNYAVCCWSKWKWRDATCSRKHCRHTCIQKHTSAQSHIYPTWGAEQINWPGSGEDSHQLWQPERNSDTRLATELQLRLTLPVERYLQSDRRRVDEKPPCIFPWVLSSMFVWSIFTCSNVTCED